MQKKPRLFSGRARSFAFMLIALSFVLRWGWSADSTAEAPGGEANGAVLLSANTFSDPTAAARADAVANGGNGAAPTGGHGQSAQHIQRDFLAILIFLLLAKLGGDLMERVKQPAVLGELLLGVVLGNLALFGVWEGFGAFIRHDIVLEALGEIGVVLLLFQIGLESSVKEMGKVGLSAFLVAAMGVIAPFFLGFGISYLFFRDVDVMVHVFIGAVLCATSVGITARVLQDIGKLDTKEAKIILGAAVVDDVLGLVVLAVVQGAITAKNAGVSLEAAQIAVIVFKASAFFIGSIALGIFLSPKLFHLASYLRAGGVLLTLSMIFCLFFSWMAGVIGLAPIVGAFCAGLVLEDASFRELGDYRRRDLRELIEPIAAFMVPIFFVRMGVLVELNRLGEGQVLLFAFALTIMAVLGKQLCAFGVREKDVDGVAVGLGMIPRGEVGLIVASIGMSMVLGGVKVVDESTYSAIVIMVMITTLITPPILAWRLSKTKKA